jgi:hypothetical protein
MVIASKKVSDLHKKEQADYHGYEWREGSSMQLLKSGPGLTEMHSKIWLDNLYKIIKITT